MGGQTEVRMETRKKFNIRISEEEKKALQKKADKYTEGNVSDWFRLAGANYEPTKDELKKVRSK